MVATHARCRTCRARRKLEQHPDAYAIQPRCSCGARDWRKDEYRHRVEKPQMRQKIGRYAVCRSCFHYPHRIGSAGCIFKPDGTYREFTDPALQLPSGSVI